LVRIHPRAFIKGIKKGYKKFDGGIGSNPIAPAILS